jgi:tetratricopeptide (TPR) repeat protein
MASVPGDPSRLSRKAILPIVFALSAVPAALCSPPPACTKPPALAARLRAHDDPETWTELGNYFGEHKQFACAQQAFRSALHFDPGSAQVNYLLGLSLYESQNFEQAIPPLQRSVRTDSAVLKPHLLLASVYTRLARPADAEEEWHAALHIDPTNTIASHGLADSLIARHDFADIVNVLSKVPLDDELAYDLAIAYSRTGRTDDAIKTITQALQSSPSSVQLSNALVTLYLKVTRTDEAERVAEKNYRLHPNDREAEIPYLRTLVVNGDWGPAKPLGTKLLAEAPHNFDVLYLNGIMERQKDEFQAARDHLTTALALQPADTAIQASLYANLGIALSRLHDPAGAKVQLQKAIGLGNKEPETHFELGNVLRALGDTDGARAQMIQYQAAVKEKDANTLAVSKSAEAAQALDKGDPQRAVELYRQAFAAAPTNALFGYKLAMALDAAGDSDGERAVLLQVVAIDPTIALAENQLGYLNSRRGDYAAAEENFQRAVNAAPGFTQAWISLAATLGMESKFPEAQQAAASALRLDPQNTEAQQLSHDLAAAQSQQPHN